MGGGWQVCCQVVDRNAPGLFRWTIKESSCPTPLAVGPVWSCMVWGVGRFELAPVIGALREVGIDVEAPVLPGHEGDGAEDAGVALDRVGGGG